MNRFEHFFLDNQWVRATGTSDIDVVNPATGQIVGRLRACSPADVHRAVASAQAGLAAADTRYLRRQSNQCIKVRGARDAGNAAIYVRLRTDHRRIGAYAAAMLANRPARGNHET